jgi:hypothetical protein
MTSRVPAIVLKAGDFKELIRILGAQMNNKIMLNSCAVETPFIRQGVKGLIK